METTISDHTIENGLIYSDKAEMTMRKKLPDYIDACAHCPYLLRNIEGKYINYLCGYIRNVPYLQDLDAIPEWCLLEGVKFP